MTLPQPCQIKLVVSDVDGTLLTSAHEVHPRVRSAVQYLQTHHPTVHIAFATGRQRISALPLAQELNIHKGFLATNHGSVIYNGEGEIIHKLSIGAGSALEAVCTAQQLDETILLGTLDDEMVLVYRRRAEGKDWIAAIKAAGVNVVDGTDGDFLRRVKEGKAPEIVTAMVALDPARAPAIIDHLGARLPASARIMHALPPVVEVIHRDANKAAAVDRLCELLGCARDNVMAFGDEANDIEMLAAAGCSVCVANAAESAKAVSKHVTLSNNEGGVGAFIERVFKPETVGA